MSDVVVTAAQRDLIARRLRRWPESFRDSHFSKLEEHERQIVALLVLELDARPEFATLVEEPPAPAPEKLFDEASGDAQRERPEPTYPRWHDEKLKRQPPPEWWALGEKLGVKRS